MYKETVKFFIRTATKEAYPVLKGGKEDSAREWAKYPSGYNHILKRTVNSQGVEIEVKNLFHKVQVIDTESRGQGGKLFKCKLFYTVEGSEESYVILDLRTESLFSIIQKGVFLNEGLFKGTYALSNTGGTYYIYNLELEDSYFYNEYQEYLSKVARESEGVVLKNTLGLNDLIEGHIYTKVSKGVVERRRYLYMGKVPIKETSISQSKVQPIYFDVDRFYEYFHYSTVFTAEADGYMSEITDFFRNRQSRGFIKVSELSQISNYSILLKTTNKFFEDVSDTEPLDLSKLFTDNLNSIREQPFLSLDNSISTVKYAGNGHFHLEKRSLDLINIMARNKNNFYIEQSILYPLERFKTVVNKDKYLTSIIKNIDNTNAKIKNYLSNYNSNEKKRLQVISKVIEEQNEYARDKRYYHQKIKSIGSYRISFSSLTKLLDNNTILIEKLKQYQN